jgi:hypothetical protein
MHQSLYIWTSCMNQRTTHVQHHLLQRGAPRSHTARVVCLVACALLASACALPVAVKRADPEVVQRQLTGYILTTGQLSLATENTLRRFLLTERFADSPERALAELHTATRISLPASSRRPIWSMPHVSDSSYTAASIRVRRSSNSSGEWNRPTWPETRCSMRPSHDSAASAHGARNCTIKARLLGRDG